MSVKTEPLRYDNCKECVSRCEHAGKDREFVYRGDKSCKIVKKQTRLDRSVWEPCEHCKPSKNPLYRWGSHQFPIDGNEIYFYDTDDGWEGEEINFCPWCSRPLTDAAWDMLEKRLESAKP